MIEAIFFDIDGTIISFETHRMTETLSEVLKQLKNSSVKLFIATGRHVSEMDEMKKYPYFDGYITLNGAYCFNDEGPYYKMPLTQEDHDKAIEIASLMKTPIALIEEFSMSVNFRNDYVIRAATMADVPIPPVQDPITFKDKDIYQLVLYCPAEEDEAILNQFNNLNAGRWHPDFVDVVPRNISKKEGILETCRIYGLNPENCIAFGDGGNDIEMLQTVGHGIAMGNASDDVKAAAKEVTLSCEEDGVIHTLKKYNLI